MAWRGLMHRGMVGLLLVLAGMATPCQGQQEGGAARENRFNGMVGGTVENALVLHSIDPKRPDYLVPVQENTQIYVENVLVYLNELPAWGHASVVQVDGLTTRIDIRGAKWGKDLEENAQRPVLTGTVLKLEKNTLTIKVGGGNPRDVTVTVSDETVVRFEGEKAPLEKIAEGCVVTVIRKDGKAMRILAQPPKVPSPKKK